MTKTQISAKATEAFLLPEMTPYPIEVVRSLLQHNWVKVTREARGFYVQSAKAGYVIR